MKTNCRRFSMELLDQIQKANDIVEVIKECLPLQPYGANFQCHCPFHKETSPSFTVNPTRQIFHCYGCHEGGNVFQFLMKHSHLDFHQTIDKLAKRAGIELVTIAAAAPCEH